MYLIFVVVVWLIYAILFLDRKKAYQAYPTVQYFIIFNLVYNFLYYNHPLWEYQGITTPILNHTFIELTFTFIILPIAILVYLQYFPKSFVHKIVYVGLWVVFFSFIEMLFFRMEMFEYSNGWSVMHSLWFNILMFSMIRLHHKKPILTIILSVPITIVLISMFPIPIGKLK
ncbi:hypothetical protein GLW08_18995 [Pontibacillus yanchengensis]|uniref:Uncharacterized protein n=2 Tax=Pontibacillus yanchengensis TaxID=462910 RepID=A0A6I4ZU50_9BACI|nr:CBO0543 family protein [Pontibacillus yanchengensis]MYL33698.1 hypothetical protein [Pontibacillus yanchengensis]MYL55404.1 hypothetical protein [Pontibacillus yanchengensis]